MKYFLLFILFIGGSVQAQTDSIAVWNKWCARADTPILFPTGNNIIQVCSKGTKPTDFIIKSLDNALKIGEPEYKGDTVSFMAMPYPKYGKRMRLTISQKSNKKVLKTVNFGCEEAPVPTPMLGNIVVDHPARKQMLAQNSLKVGFRNSLYSYPYRVKQYTFKARVGGKDIVIPVKGSLITNEISNLLSIAAEGTFVEFTDVKASCYECEPRILADLKLWIGK